MTTLKKPDLETMTPYEAYKHARDVVKGRWQPGEMAIAEDAEWSLEYAREIVKGRFPEGEAAIAKDAGTAAEYARESEKWDSETAPEMAGVKGPSVSGPGM